jgi:hypothetical protein
MRKISVLILPILILAGCGSKYNDHRGRGDAPVKGNSGDDSPAIVINFPDGFMNVAFKCIGPNGIYTHTREAAPVIVKDDPNCDEGKAR